MKSAYVYPFCLLLSVSSVFADNKSQSTSNDYPDRKVQFIRTNVSDRTLESLVRNKLKTDPQLVNSEIKVKCINGIVCVSGVVEYDIQAEKIVVITQSIRGVKDVDVCNLQIEKGKTPTKLMLRDDYITAKIEGALVRENLLDIVAEGLRIKTENGVVYLRGCVNDILRVRNIIELIESVPEVVEIIDAIKVG